MHTVVFIFRKKDKRRAEISILLPFQEIYEILLIQF